MAKLKILFVNERVRHKNVLPSIGLVLLATLAKQRGHRAKVLDYQITPNAPNIRKYVTHLRPDVVGVRCINENWRDASAKIDQIRSLVDFIIVGGPYPTLHFQELREDPRIDAIFTGEAEDRFLTFLSDVQQETVQKIYRGEPIQVTKLPLPDFTLFHNYKQIQQYPLQTSRGCPFACSFCVTKLLNSRRWRKRSLTMLIMEILQAIQVFPQLKRIVIIDDSPMNDPAPFVQLLQAYRQLMEDAHAPPISVLNIRADKVTPKIAQLLAQCGCKRIVIGVETIGQKAMRFLGKRIHPDDIRRAKRLFEHVGICVGGSFIVGLPWDDWHTLNETMQFAMRIGLEYSHWSQLLPFKGTRVRNHVTVLDDYTETMVAPGNGEIITKVGSETRELPAWWQVKGWLRGSIITNPHSVFTRWNPMPTVKMLLHCLRYAEVHTLARYGIRYLGRWLAGRESDPRKVYSVEGLE